MSIRALLTIALATAGCASVVVVEDPVEDGGASTGGGGGGSCSVDPETTVRIESVRSATLFGEVLHVEGVVDGSDGYAVIDLSSRTPQLVARRDDLLGGAKWTQAVGDYYVRFVGDRLDVMDAADPAAPVVVSSTALGSPLQIGFDTIGSDGTALYACIQPPSGTPTFLSRLDLTDPAHPAAPVVVEDQRCDLPASALFEGSLFLRYDGSSMSMFDLATGESRGSHSFETEGVHHYGEFTAIATDGSVVATTLENEAYAFLYYAAESVAVYSSFGEGPKRLLEVVFGQAFMASATDGGITIIAFEIDPPPAWEQEARRMPTQVLLEGGSSTLEDYAALTIDTSRMIVSDGAEIFDVLVGGFEPVEPMVVVRAGFGDLCAP